MNVFSLLIIDIIVKQCWTLIEVKLFYDGERSFFNTCGERDNIPRKDYI